MVAAEPRQDSNDIAPAHRGGTVPTDGPRSIPRPEPRDAARGWWDYLPVLVLITLCSAVPLLWPHVPPLLDLPSHMAGYHVALHLADSPSLRHYFGFHWHVIGNLGVDLAMLPLGKVFGTEAAAKLVVVAIPMLTAAGLLLVSRAALGRVQPTAIAAVPIAYNYPLMLGFVNYNLASALALIAFGVWLRWPSQRRPVVRATAFAAAGAAIWLCHAIGWVLLCTMIGAAELHRRWIARQSIARVATGAVVACLPLALPLALMPMSPASGSASASGFFALGLTAKWMAMLLRDRWIGVDLSSTGCLLALIAAALFRIGGLRVSPVLAWPALAVLLLFVVAPQEISGSAYVAARLWPYVAILAVLMVDCSGLTAQRQRWVAFGCMAFMVGRLSVNTVSFLLYDRAYMQELQALRYVPRGGAVVALVGLPCHNSIANWADPRLYHLPGLAVVRKEAFVNTTWSVGGLHLLENRFRPAGVFASDPSEMVSAESCTSPSAPPIRAVLSRLPYRAFDCLWLLNVPREAWPHDQRLRPVWWSTRSVIYAIRVPG